MATTARPVPRVALTVEEAAQSLGISRATAYRRIADGRLRSVKVHGVRRVPVEALGEFLAKGVEAA
ncbi:helix-turn-helix domain-containing protein [Nocardiopsis alba]|uniref:helix-turn-helix domain-containing protein n=1 Tax=Nocardiopsis alba TaxID=53437 RepID=UPI0035DCD5AF